MKYLFFGATVLGTYFVSLIIVSAVLIIPFLFSLFIDNLLVKKNKFKIKHAGPIYIIFGILVLLMATYQTYRAYYPSDSFYWDEYKNITQLKKPSSGKIIKKSADYPDMHGDYSSCAFIQVTEEDYNLIYNRIENDSSMIDGDFKGSWPLDRVLKDDEYKEIKNGFIRRNKDDVHLYIGFFKDGKSIIIHRSSS